MIPHPYPESLPEGVLFDWDGTLVDTHDVCFHAINTVFAHFHRPLFTREEFARQPALSIHDCFSAWFPKDFALAVEMFRNAISETNRLDALRPVDGALPVLQWLHSHGVFMSVVSNKEGDVLRREIAHLKWEHFFHNIVGSRDAEADKPSPLPLLKALTHGPMPGHSVWFVGDTNVDMHCAKNAGCIPVGIAQTALIDGHPVVNLNGHKALAQLLETLSGMRGQQSA